jgi:hypothetical protein
MAVLRPARPSDLASLLDLQREYYAQDVRALHLEVERSKESALGLYSSVGFEDHDRCLMTKRLG